MIEDHIAIELYCAVDVRGGRCVRLRQGDYEAETRYDNDPVAVAVRMAEAGADWIHVVDLDGARSGCPENAEIVAEIAASTDVPVQAGGGIRSQATAEAWFAAGVERIVLGTVALREPEMVVSLARSHRVAVALDARHGEVATDGWLQGSGASVLDSAIGFAGTDVDALVVTDITRDGMLQGPDLKGLSGVLDATAGTTGNRASPIDVIASGGVSGVDDLRNLAQLRSDSDRQRMLSGVIVGKALYEKRFTVAEAVRVLKQSTS